MQNSSFNLFTTYSYKIELMKLSMFSKQLTSKISKKEEQMMSPARSFSITCRPILTFILEIRVKNLLL